MGSVKAGRLAGQMVLSESSTVVGQSDVWKDCLRMIAGGEHAEYCRLSESAGEDRVAAATESGARWVQSFPRSTLCALPPDRPRSHDRVCRPVRQSPWPGGACGLALGCPTSRSDKLAQGTGIARQARMPYLAVAASWGAAGRSHECVAGNSHSKRENRGTYRRHRLAARALHLRGGARHP